jgi:hypothetical protein
MSLTSSLRIKEVKEAFASEFEKPKLKLDWKIKVPPGTTNYALVGTAFDYLMRFYLERLNLNSWLFPPTFRTQFQLTL